MMSDFRNIQISHILLFIAIGIVLFMGLYIVNNYILPMLKKKHFLFFKYWQKIQLIVWIGYSFLFYVTLFRSNMPLTLIISGIIIGIGWDYWRNIFSGIIIKINNQFRIGETISTENTTGKIISINLSHTELTNDSGELISIPNYVLRSSILKHLFKKSTVQLYTFNIHIENADVSTIKNLAILCPFISSNQKIEVEKIKDSDYILRAGIIDISFAEEVNDYFKRNKI